jgi:hypothetical protein
MARSSLEKGAKKQEKAPENIVGRKQREKKKIAQTWSEALLFPGTS